MPEPELRTALGLKPGETPFPWQEALLAKLEGGSIPRALDIPTGLGKTSVIALWLVARARGAKLPRRLVYVVDRRAVVDQATTVAEGLRAWVDKSPDIRQRLGLGDRSLPISTLRGQHIDNREWLEDPSLPAIIVGTVDMVGSRLLFEGYGTSRKMRPYHAALLGCDTLIVLDEAHLVPPFEALLESIATDEALHPREPERALVPRLRVMSLSATGRGYASPLTLSEEDRKHPIVKKRLDAKKRLTIEALGEKETLPEALAARAWALSEQGQRPIRCVVFADKRKDALEAKKLIEARAKGERLDAELLVGERRVFEREGVSEWLAAKGFFPGAGAPPPAQQPAQVSLFDAKPTASAPTSRERPAFLFATSAGEVGVDLDAEHMVSDLVAWERMVQRLGRVNRRGDGDAKVVVVLDSEPVPVDGAKKALEKRDAARTASRELEELTEKLNAAREKEPLPKGKRRTSDEKVADEKRKQAENELKKSISTCRKRIEAFKDADAKVAASHEAEVAKHRALRKLLEAVGEGGSLSPNSLLQLRQRGDLAEALRDATTVEPLRPELTRALVDAWSMTSLDEHPGRPAVEPWLRGFHPNDPPQTTVVWRRNLPVRSDESFDIKAAQRFFEAAPPHASEQLEAETDFVSNWLIKRAEAVGKAETGELLTPKSLVAIVLSPRCEVKGARTLEQLGAAKGKDGQRALKELLAGATLVVDARLGGLDAGLLHEKTHTMAAAADDLSTTWRVRADTDVPVTGFRIHPIRTGEQGDKDAAWRHTISGRGWVRRYLFVTKVVDGEPSAALAIEGWSGDAATEDERAEADRPQQLEEHQSWTKECAKAIVDRLCLNKDDQELLMMAARLHDEGKRAARWQRAFKAPRCGVYAKTTGPIDFVLLDGYRHELGSLPYVEKDEQFIKLSEHAKDLVLHLIAAHHGYARPIIGTSGCDDAPPSVVDDRAREVALRFARLSRRWGPWGLAWWEALLRAADQTASRRNQQASVAGTHEKRD